MFAKFYLPSYSDDSLFWLQKGVGLRRLQRINDSILGFVNHKYQIHLVAY